MQICQSHLLAGIILKVIVKEEEETDVNRDEFKRESIKWLSNVQVDACG